MFEDVNKLVGGTFKAGNCASCPFFSGDFSMQVQKDSIGNSRTFKLVHIGLFALP